MNFSGTYEDLKEKLKSIPGEWRDPNANMSQLRYNDGIMNWHHSTGTLQFQGKMKAKEDLEGNVQRLLESAASDAASPAPPLEETVSGTEGDGGTPEQPPTPEIEENKFLGGAYKDSELVIGLVGAVGTKQDDVITRLTERLRRFGYETVVVRISKDVISGSLSLPTIEAGEFERISSLIDAGDKARKSSKDNSILALGAAGIINAQRSTGEDKHKKRTAYIINSLKHPEEVRRLREIYSNGFYLLGVHSDKKRRLENLKAKGISEDDSLKLIERDSDEKLKFGQKTSETFHMSDFFLYLDKDSDQMEKDIWRFLDLIFSHPHKTPTFDEFAMFMAFSSSLRSADLSRQVGAIIAKDEQIVATGANDSPRYGGGLYWPQRNDSTGEIEDEESGRDYMIGHDSNRKEQQDIINGILSLVDGEENKKSVREALSKSRIKDLTEYGRVVHAEMEALLSCSRSNISSNGATLYCTTFPCHNCAKHIIASGIERVVYVEPYPKSKACEFHPDSIQMGICKSDKESKKHVNFEPFVGVGARRFFDLFSMGLGIGSKLIRKDGESGDALYRDEADLNKENMRIQLLPCSYIEREEEAAKMLHSLKTRIAESE